MKIFTCKNVVALVFLITSIVSYIGVVYKVSYDDNQLSKKNMSQFHTLDPSTLDYRAIKILSDKGCSYCHTPNSEMPFYSQFPIAKQIMEHDVKNAIRHFDMTEFWHDIKNNQSISEVALARIEKVINDDSMPPSIYLTMHWSSNISEKEKDILLRWINEKRTDKYIKSPVPDDRKNSVLQPIYTNFEIDKKKASLGKFLFNDTRLSLDNSISCASCHNLTTGGVDQRLSSIGIHGQVGNINAPTVFNAVYNKKQFWDGRADSLQDQAGGPPFNPVEMGSESWDQIINKLRQDPVLVKMFDDVYSGDINGNNITNAIAEFEKTLTTPNSRFDQYLMGNDHVLTPNEKYGLELFNKYNCQTCHAGESLGGGSFETMGLKENYF
ncbi:cytochrome-c peroxidase, partial [Vibrio parahaemolyticus]|nr:cytochrome-c peroxidase [Vibrio parahaemolyticus]